MRKGRVFLIAALVLLVVIAGSIAYILTNLDFIVKSAIEKFGSQAVKTAVRVSSVSIRLSSGEASITGLTVANPSGFSAPHIFSLGDISTKIAVKSVTKSLIVIQDIRVTAPEVFYEVTQGGTSNIDVLKENLRSKEPQKKAGEKKEKTKEKRLSIRKLVIDKGHVEARIPALGSKPVMLDLPRIELNDIGGSGGATPEEAARTVATALARETAAAVARSQGEKYIKKGAEDLLNRYLGK